MVGVDEGVGGDGVSGREGGRVFGDGRWGIWGYGIFIVGDITLGFHSDL